jgi:hypothetical protein
LNIQAHCRRQFLQQEKQPRAAWTQPAIEREREGERERERGRERERENKITRQ